MNKHFEFIERTCTVKEIVGEDAIYFIDDGRGYAEINGTPFQCDSLEEFHQMVEQFGDDTFEI